MRRVVSRGDRIILTSEDSYAEERAFRSPLGRVLAQQAALAEMAQRALDERDLGTLLNELCVLAGRVLETEMVDVLELAPDRRSLRVVAGIGWRPGVVGGLVVPAAKGSQSGYTLATGGPVIAEDLHAETRFAIPETLREHGVRSGVTVRIGSAIEPYGVLATFTAEQRAFSHDDAGFLQSLANVIGSAVARLRAEAELRRSRDEMATIVANVTDGITVQAPDGRLLFANDAAARLSGFASAAELIAAPVARVMAAFELLDESGSPMPAERLPGRVALATGEPAPPTPVRFRVHATGEERWSLVQAVPVRDVGGSVAQVINVFRDVTDERRNDLAQATLYEAVNERRAELETVIGAMDEAVLLFDDGGELRLGNDSATRLFGGTPPASLDELRARLSPADERDGDGEDDGGDDDGGASLRGLPSGTSLEGERRLVDSGRWLEVRVHRSPASGTAAARSRSSVVVLRDVTEARAAQVARDAFLGVLSHELRTPITTIYGGSELLERELDPQRRAEVIGDIRAEAERLARLVEDLLVMSRVERGGVEPGDEPVLLQRLLPPLAAALKSRWPTLAVELDLAEGLPAVRGDLTYLEQVMRNLLTNSVRYGDALTHGVAVRAVAEAQRVRVQVLDRGAGPGTSSPDRLFELFYRAPAARAVPGGAGIGLFVCRQLVEAMGGTIWAARREGGGSEFGFFLPIIEGDTYA